MAEKERGKEGRRHGGCKTVEKERRASGEVCTIWAQGCASWLAEADACGQTRRRAKKGARKHGIMVQGKEKAEKGRRGCRFHARKRVRTAHSKSTKARAAPDGPPTRPHPRTSGSQDQESLSPASRPRPPARLHLPSSHPFPQTTCRLSCGPTCQLVVLETWSRKYCRPQWSKAVAQPGGKGPLESASYMSQQAFEAGYGTTWASGEKKKKDEHRKSGQRCLFFFATISKQWVFNPLSSSRWKIQNDQTIKKKTSLLQNPLSFCFPITIMNSYSHFIKQLIGMKILVGDVPHVRPTMLALQHTEPALELVNVDISAL
jgi:hypothetical protein